MSSERHGPVRSVDEQQTRLLDSLRAADGAPVSFQELRSNGIENPAMLCYELELAGMRITRVHHPNGQRAQTDLRSLGVQLDEPSRVRRPVRLGSSPRFSAWRRWRASGRMTSPRRRGFQGSPVALGRAQAYLAAHPIRPGTVAAMLALSVAAAAFATIVLTYHEARQPTGQAITPGSARSHPQRNSHPAGRQTQPRPSITPAPGTTAAVSHARSASDAGALPSAPDSQPARPQSNTAAAVQLQAEGHQLLGEGHYENAIGDLRSALTSTGQSAAGCAQPTTEVCLTYAYALYDLGRALRLGGNPAAALPILAERLRIDNQRPVVEHELDLARTQLRASATAHPTHP